MCVYFFSSPNQRTSFPYRGTKKNKAYYERNRVLNNRVEIKNIFCTSCNKRNFYEPKQRIKRYRYVELRRAFIVYLKKKTIDNVYYRFYNHISPVIIVQTISEVK